MSTATKHSWFKSGLRFCGSCSVTLACWALWILLGVLLAALLYIAVAKELPVPGYVLRRIEGEMARSGLILHFGRARFDPTGKLLLQDVRLRATQFEDPLLTCRLLYVRHDPWALLAGRTFPEEIQIEGAALHLPAMLSPSGTAEPVVRDLAATLRYRDRLWRVEQFAGRFGRLTLSVQGEFTPPRAGPEQPDLQKLTARFLQTARQLAPFAARLEAFDEPNLAVRLETDHSGRNRATLLLAAAGARQPWDQPLVLGPFAAATTFVLGRTQEQGVLVQAAVRQLEAQAGVRAESVRLQLRATVAPVSLTARAGELRLAAGRLAFKDGAIDGPMLRATLDSWPRVQAELSARVEGETFAAEVEAALNEKSARIRAAGRAHHDLITRTLARHTPRAEPYFRFGDPVEFDAEAWLAPGWRLDRVTAWAGTGRLDSRGVPISSARGRIQIVGRSFLADEARVSLGGNLARGSYWMDFGTTDYRMLLHGHLHPVAIQGWFRGDWWPAFWNRWFAFPADAPPSGEVDIQGRWKTPALSNNFVRARTDRAAIWGGDFESADATLFIRPGFVHGLALHGTRAAGRENVRGTFKRFGVPDSRATDRFEFDFTTDADPAVLGRMLEGRADDVLASLKFTASPQIHAWGELAGGEAGLVPAYRFAANMPVAFTYYGFPLESAEVAGTVAGREVKLEKIVFAAAGGSGEGKATLSGLPGGRQLGFDLYLNRARLGATVHAVQQYDAARTGTPVPAGPDSQFVRPAASSLLDISLTALGDPADLASFKGSGRASLTGGQLGEVHLFGLLSQVLSGLTLSFSSLKFDTAFTSMDLDRGELSFPDLKVTGPSATIDARGRYAFATNSLDFTAKFKPYEQPGSLLAVAVSLVMNPLTSMLELKLNGPLGNPKWSYVVAPGSKPAAPVSTEPPPVISPGPDRSQPEPVR
ncbi:MAG: hypothetical protein QG602_2437 [Verrucomicrobiota bacterium]|nr:hypothetical protein [Verrucomicrobiota bacterium]